MHYFRSGTNQRHLANTIELSVIDGDAGCRLSVCFSICLSVCLEGVLWQNGLLDLDAVWGGDRMGSVEGWVY